MRPNGLCLVVELAVRRVESPLVDRWRKALLLGALREDVAYVPVLGTVFEHLSPSHFGGAGARGGFFPFLWPGPRGAVARNYRRAVRPCSRSWTIAIQATV